jgi:hypothetical protein
MPELPEVETTVRGLTPALLGQRIARVQLRRPDLRRAIWKFGRAHPDLSVQDIAVHFGVNAARVSETLNPTGDWESKFAEEVLDDTMRKARAA